MNVISSEWYRVDGGAIETELNLDNVEKEMWVYISANSKRKFQPKESYDYQYKTVSDTQIKINAICDLEKRSKTNINKEFYLVFDGGSCFFEINYNSKSNEFSELWVNGEA